MQRAHCVWPSMFYFFHLRWLKTTRQAVLLAYKHFIAFSPRHIQFQKTASRFYFTVHCTASKHSTPVHQMQYYIPTPQSPNKTLWCQIDTLVNSTSWIWYCLATAENPLLVDSSGWGADGSEDGLGGGDKEGEWWMVLTVMVLYDVGFCLACLQAVEQN